MLRKLFRILVVAVVCFIVMPSAATRAATTGGCFNCGSEWNYETNRPTIGCNSTSDGEMGFTSCKTDCYKWIDQSICTCTTGGNSCMIIWVTPN